MKNHFYLFCFYNVKRVSVYSFVVTYEFFLHFVIFMLILPFLGWKRGSAGLWSEALQAEDIALCLCVFVQCLLCSIAAMRRQPILPSLPPFLPPASAPLSLVFNQIIFPICVSYSHPFIRNPNHIPSPRSPFQLSISSPDLSSISLQLAI